MSDALLPWIRDYIVELAENYGANISNLPLYPKNKKAQVTQFLTYGSDDEDTLIWAEISDKKYVIPVKFTKEAVADYRKSHPGQRLTRHKGGIFKITAFRPICTRVPRSNNTLSPEPSLVIECNSVTDLGSSGEATFGNPEPILNEPDIRLWSDGLKRDGGAANILKERKMQRALAKRMGGATQSKHIVLPTPDRTEPVENVKDLIHLDITRTKHQLSSVEAYNARWQKISKNAEFLENINGKGKEPAVEKDAVIAPLPQPLELEEEESPIDVEVQHIPSSRSGTPFTIWEATPNKRAKSPAPTPPSANNFPSSSIGKSHTPAQRMKASMMYSTPDHRHSSYPSGNETVLENASSNTRNANARRSVTRKIPRPASPEPPKYSGPARILAPNSDTSGTQSQSQSQSQSQPEQNKKEVIDCKIEEGFIRNDRNWQKEAAGRSVLGIDEEMAGDYPWLDLWHIRDIMARTVEARRGA